MLRHSKSLHGWHIHAADGQVGKLIEFYFDDTTWDLRYLVVNTGSWLLERLVLLSPVAVTGIVEEHKEILVALTRDQVEHSPDVDVDKPVSRQEEMALHTHYAWPVYWATNNPYEPEQTVERLEVTDYTPTAREMPHQDPHLRSSREVTGYRMHATDGIIGHVVDMLVDDSTWKVAFLEAATNSWLPGQHILLLPDLVQHINWGEATVSLGVDQETLRHAPPYDRHEAIPEDLEHHLRLYYEGAHLFLS